MSTVAVAMKALPSILRNTEARIRAAVYDGAMRGCNEARKIIVPLTPKDLGPTQAGWKIRALYPSIARKRAAVTVAELYNDMPTVMWLEMGTRPHPVSRAGVAAIYEWVRRHFRGGALGTRDASRGRMRRPAPNGTDPVIMSITWAIVTKIKKYGMKPRLFVLGALPEMRMAMAIETANALNAAQSAIEADARRSGGA